MITSDSERELLYRDLQIQVANLRASMLRLEAQTLPRLGEIQPENIESAKNLAHYVALRRADLRVVQDKLASVGLSSLGRSESHVLATVDAVLETLTKLARVSPLTHKSASLSYDVGRALLKRNSDALLGVGPKQRSVRIMVTMPTEAASDYGLVERLLMAGMNLMRINCAHDNPGVWEGMIENLGKAKKETKRDCRLIMDLPGPKVRTGPMKAGPKIRKVRPARSQDGTVVAPAVVSLSLGPSGSSAPAAGITIQFEANTPLVSLKAGDRLRFRDARNSKRSLTIVSVDASRITVELRKTAYFETGAKVYLRNGEADGILVGTIGEIPPIPGRILLKKGDSLVLTRSETPGRPADYRADGSLETLPRVSCTAPQAIESLKQGESVWFDDGKMGGVVRELVQEGAVIEITSSPPEGFDLEADKGINLPDSDLRLPAISVDDEETLRFIAKNADLVGQSFVRHPRDVLGLQSRLGELGGANVGIVLKIETRQGFDNLLGLLFAAMKSRNSGVMIARGDLAVECGWERLAEIQEEILWFCEAAHVPVVWATQVLESLTKTGVPSRAEITDAAFSEAAECVMLNKGPHIVEAVTALDDILRRMASHKEKKSAMLRRLHIADNFMVA